MATAGTASRIALRKWAGVTLGVWGAGVSGEDAGFIWPVFFFGPIPLVIAMPDNLEMTTGSLRITCVFGVC